MLGFGIANDVGVVASFNDTYDNMRPRRSLSGPRIQVQAPIMDAAITSPAIWTSAALSWMRQRLRG